MRVVLQAGAEIETLTSEELSQELARFRKSLDRGDTFTEETGFSASAAGAVGPLAILTIPLGFRLRVHRVTWGDDSSTFGAPLTSAGAYGAFFRNSPTYNRLICGSPSGSAAVLPGGATFGTYDAPVLRGGENLIVVASGLPGNDEVSVGVQGWMTTDGPERAE